MRKLLILLLILPFIYACSSEDDDSIHGEWYGQYEFKNNEYEHINKPPYKVTKFIFNKDGSYSFSGIYGDSNGTFEQTNDNIILYDKSDNENGSINILSINKNELEISLSANIYNKFQTVQLKLLRIK